MHSQQHIKKNCISLCGPGSSVSIATGYGLNGLRQLNPGGGARIYAPVHTGPGAHPASCTMGTWSFRGVKSGRGVTLTPHPLLVPWSWKGRAIPLLPLWAVRPVQSLSACTGVTFTFFNIHLNSKKCVWLHIYFEGELSYSLNTPQSQIVLEKQKNFSTQWQIFVVVEESIESAAEII